MQQPPAMREFEFSSSDFRFIAELVAKETGIVLAEHKHDMVYARIARRLRSLGLSSFRSYCELLASEGARHEITHFVNALTTNMTSFFREAHHFDHLKETVLRPMVKAGKPCRIRLWSAACSHGAEAYSMAMTCLEILPDISRWDIKILATDIDTAVLQKAGRGIFSEPEMSGIPALLRERYTTRTPEGEASFISAVRSLICFKHLNLIHDWPFRGPFNAVFCRNVVIYFNKTTQQRLFERMTHYIQPSGWLYLGHSESLHGISSNFVLKGKTTYQRCA